MYSCKTLNILYCTVLCSKKCRHCFLYLRKVICTYVFDRKRQLVHWNLGIHMQVNHICLKSSFLLMTRRWIWVIISHLSKFISAGIWMAMHALLQPFLSIDSGVKWPELSSWVGELGCHGETIIRSEEGRAVLTLAPSGQEFSVKYTCSLSSSHSQKQSTQPGHRESESSPVHAWNHQSAAAAAAADDDDDEEEQLDKRKRKLIRLVSGTVQPKVWNLNSILCLCNHKPYKELKFS